MPNNASQPANNEIRTDIPRIVEERFFGEDKVGEDLIRRALMIMEDAHRIPAVAAPITEQAAVVPVAPSSNVIDLEVRRQAVAAHTPEVTTTLTDVEQQPETLATDTPVPEGEQARLRREASERINSIHDGLAA